MHRFISHKSPKMLQNQILSWNRNLGFSYVACKSAKNVLLKKPKICPYRNCKTFNEQSFRTELHKELAKIGLNNAELAEFQDEFLSVLNKYAPLKYKYIRANKSSYLTKSVRKEIMLHSRLRSKFLKTKSRRI